MTTRHSLDQLETDVLVRIAQHRRSQHDPEMLPTGLTLAVIAMTVGMMIGWNHAQQQSSPHGSESIVLADDARLAPSALLAANSP